MKHLLILLLLLSSCFSAENTCDIVVRHLPENPHNLPVKLVIGKYESHILYPNQTLTIDIYKNVELEFCIESYSNINNGDVSEVELYSAEGELIIRKRMVFENRPSLCAFQIHADDGCEVRITK